MNSRIVTLSAAILVLLLIATAAAQDVNLTLTDRFGWYAPVVPKVTQDATMTSCYLGYRISTPQFYWNAHGENTGSDSTPGGFDVAVYLDGTWKGLASAPATAGEFAVLNQGPVSADICGLHTLSCYVDAFHSITETNENDNVWGGQYCWDFIGIWADGASVVHVAPPDPTGGWTHIVDGSTPRENCDGYLFHSTSLEWHAITVAALDNADNDDARLYQMDSNDNSGGFHTLRASSDRGAGLLDVLFLNVEYDNFFYDYFNVAVVNGNNGDSDYRITHRLGYELPFDSEYSFTLTADDNLDIWGLSLDETQQGPVMAVLESDPGSGLHLLRLDSRDEGWWFWSGTLSDAAAATVVDDTGIATLQWDILDDAEQALVVYRDPGVSSGTVSGTIKLLAPAADLAFHEAAWWSPLVPSDEIMTDNPVFLPSELPGNVDGTYHNYLIRNEGFAATGNFSNRLLVDGALGKNILYLWGVAAQTTQPYWQKYADEMCGGRHTLSLHLDIYDAVDEINEANNVYGEQYCWTPLDLTYGAVVTRPRPQNAFGGWDDVASGEPLYPNCDGLRLPYVGLSGEADGWWRAVAVMPLGNLDVDLALHDPATGTKDGFTDALATSLQPAGSRDYVLINCNHADNTDYDVGVQSEGVGIASYTAGAVLSDYLTSDPDGAFGPFDFPAGHCLQLREMHLPVGPVAFRLDNLGDDGILGLTLHDAATTFASHATGHVTGGIAQADAPGESVWLTVDIATQGYYCLAVWKAGDDDLDLDLSYRLRIMPGVTPVPETPTVLATRLCAAQPNPFNPRTTVVFELAQHSHARVEVFDLQGRLVRILCDEERPQGRHEVIWTGVDATGRQASSGVYVVRLNTGKQHSAMQVTLVK